MRAVPLLSSLLFAVTASTAAAQVTVAVDPTADVHPISTLIYGVNFPTDAQIAQGRLTLSRWGGNATSRYNYLIDVQNTGSDYYFENVAGCWNAADAYCATPPSDPREHSAANAFLAQAAANWMTALLTVPMLGWVAKPPAPYAHPLPCGCSAAGQQAYDPYDAACGNGKDASGNWMSGACDPASTSMPVDAGWDGQWAQYLVQKFGPSNGQRIYELDNEPNLWSETHHDVHPQPLTYDEAWSRMRETALAILAADPTARIAAPSAWGWPNYFCSAADHVDQGCFATSPDRAAHGGEEFIAWILDQAHAYQQQTGTPLLHDLDLHYYPQGGDPPENLRSLWDPTYVDPSWIHDTIRLIPRMHDWVNQHDPGLTLSIGEYDWYHHDEPLGAIAYAEGLGIFGREGLDAATAWSAPAADEIGFAAFKLFRNYDGAGGAFGGTSVRATVTGAGVKAYAATDPGRLTVALVNEGASAQTVSVQLGSFPGARATAFSNQGTANLAALASPTLSAGAVQLQLPASSINMLVVERAGSGSTGGASASTGSSGAGASAGSSGAMGSSTGTTGAVGASTGGSSGTPGSSSAGAGASGSTGGSPSKAKASGCQSAGGAGLWGLLALGLWARRRERA